MNINMVELVLKTMVKSFINKAVDNLKILIWIPKRDKGAKRVLVEPFKWMKKIMSQYLSVSRAITAERVLII